MTQSVPDSVSLSDLEAFAKKAATETEPRLYDGLTATEVQELAMETLRGMSRKCKDPMVEKCMMLAMAMSWIKWHTELAQGVMPATSDSSKSEEATDFATALLRDAGKAQAIYMLVHDIGMDNDFILGLDQDSE
jgi:hypothetical protein